MSRGYETIFGSAAKMANPYIFGIGVAKTGSHSLAAALELLGVCTKHIGHECYHGRGEWLAVMKSNKAAGRLLCAGIDADALIDWPICDWFDVLADQYPHAKFILSYRPPHDCALSWIRMTMAQSARHVGARGYAEFANYAVAHVDAVWQRFRRDPSRLLLLDMRDADATKWAALCQFLKKPLPLANTPFPQEFRHDEWQTDAGFLKPSRGL